MASTTALARRRGEAIKTIQATAEKIEAQGGPVLPALPSHRDALTQETLILETLAEWFDALGSRLEETVEAVEPVSEAAYDMNDFTVSGLRHYAQRLGIDVPDDATRDDIEALINEHKG